MKNHDSQYSEHIHYPQVHDLVIPPPTRPTHYPEVTTHLLKWNHVVLTFFLSCSFSQYKSF